ncbi:MAG: hypothetical protein WAM97_18515 [Acidimicrobiales bacterium]
MSAAKRKAIDDRLEQIQDEVNVLDAEIRELARLCKVDVPARRRARRSPQRKTGPT